MNRPFPLKLVLSGFGNVGRQFIRLLREKTPWLLEKYSLNVRVCGVAELGGGLRNRDGLDLDALAALPSLQALESLPGFNPSLSRTSGIIASGASVLVEATPTNLETGQPGLENILAALEHRMHAVTLAKGPLVCAFPRVMSLARERNVQVRFSGATAAALPTMDVSTYILAGCRISRISGILNGTTNYILTRMAAENVDYAVALSEAQELGIAERDPRLDVEGWDTAAKILILANAVLGAGLTLRDVPVQGIQDITVDEIRHAAARGAAIKLVGEAEQTDKGVKVRVGPVELPGDHPFFSVSGTTKAVHFETDTMGPLTVIGGKSDPRAAAAAALKDIINLSRESSGWEGWDSP